MKTHHAFQVLGLCLVLAANALAQPGPPKDETFSENRKFSLEISETEINKPLLAVFARDGDSPRLLWSQSLAPKGDLDDPAAFSLNGSTFSKTLSNDGSIVVLRPQYAHNEQPAVRIITQKGKDAVFSAEDLTALVEDSIEEDHPNVFQGAGSLLELLLETENPPLYALWISSARQWLAFDLNTLQVQLAPTETANRLNQVGLGKAREIVRQSQGGGSLSRMLNSIRRKAAEVIPGVMPEENQVDQAVVHVAYRFLAHRKQPEDKPLLEKLLEGKVSAFSSGSPYGNKHFGAYSPDRTLGEELLAVWDGKELQEFDDRLAHPFFTNKKFQNFGSLHGTVFLPFKNPDSAGPLCVYLIPAEVASSDLANEAVLKTSISFDDRMFGPPGQVPTVRHDKARFTMDTLTPGEYRLKAFWDRRGPARRVPGPPVPESPGPGDYESAESQVFKVTAGERVKNIVLECTNRIGQAAQHFAEDEEWAAQHPTNREEEEDLTEPWRARRDRVLVSSPVADWIIRTNENTGDIHVNRIRLAVSEDIRTGEGTRQLRIRFSAPAPKNRNDWANYEGRLEDEHGCRFTAGGANMTRRTHELIFSVVPYGAKEIKLVITRQNHEAHNTPGQAKLEGASFTLRNLCNVTPENWTAEKLPSKRDLGIATVELAKVDPQAIEFSAEYLANFYGNYLPGHHPGMQRRPPENTFSFERNGKPALGWRKISGKYVDRWGNESTSLQNFCSQEELFELSADFARDPERENFLPQEIWELTITNVPGPGESLPLALTNELESLKIKLFSVGGTGEFTYENGRLIAATNRLTDGGFAARFLPNQRSAPQPKLFLVTQQRPGMPFYYGGRRPPGPVTIGAKIPHLACHIPDASRETLVALLQEDTSVPEPMNAPPQQPGGGYYGGPRAHSALKFLPLDYRSGDRDVKLTFVAQKPRTAEFIVHVPKSERTPPQH